MLGERLAGSPSGQLIPIEDGQFTFMPYPLPRYLELDHSLIILLDRATRAVATLSGVGETLPNPHLLIRPFVRREAVLSSRIEGTQTSLSDLLLYEASDTGSPKGDLEEVINYIKASTRGLSLLGELPICVRLINIIHSVLLSGVRGADKQPGELRTTQVWIGALGTPIQSAKFVPPPPTMIQDLLSDWERFVNQDNDLPPLIQCALMHYQFEAIHPFTDGNGRIGRLLIVLFLCAQQILPLPLLYLSAYFERTRDQYYEQLFRVSETGDWNSWLSYFLTGVAEQANDALLRARRVRKLHGELTDLLHEHHETANALRLLDELFERPFMAAPRAAKLLEISTQGARGILDRLAELGIVQLNATRWPRVYVLRELLNVVDAPTFEPSST